MLLIDDRHFLLPVDGQMFVFGNLHHLLVGLEIHVKSNRFKKPLIVVSYPAVIIFKTNMKEKKSVLELLVLSSYHSVSGTYSQRHSSLCSSTDLFCSADVSGSGKWTALFWELQ